MKNISNNNAATTPSVVFTTDSALLISENLFSNPNFTMQLNFTSLGMLTAMLTAPYNWWGSNNASLVQQSITDFWVNSSYFGLVNYSPFLNTSVYYAPAISVSRSPYQYVTTNTTWTPASTWNTVVIDNV